MDRSRSHPAGLHSPEDLDDLLPTIVRKVIYVNWKGPPKLPSTALDKETKRCGRMLNLTSPRALEKKNQ